MAKNTHKVGPLMVPIRQSFDKSKINDIEKTILEQFQNPAFKQKFSPGARVAVGVGSRGVKNIQIIAKAVIKALQKLGTSPFIVPAMGSHGGATAEGQIGVLAQYGITEKAMGVPILSSMEVVELGKIDGKVPVYFDHYAAEADAIVVINRIKSHTSLSTDVQSGLMKMLAIGLGKHKGASTLHSYGIKRIQRYIPEAARLIMSKAPYVCGVGVVENSYGETHTIEVLPAGILEENEKRLLRLSKSLMAHFPVDSFDILIVEEMGKNFAGTGMDCNIIGRWKIWGEPELPSPAITTIIALDLSDISHGNAGGIGLADIITRRLYNKIDYHVTYTNAITATFLLRVQVPVTVETDKEAFFVALQVCGEPVLEKLKVIRIRNTQDLSNIWVSEGILREIEAKEVIEVLGPPDTLHFDGSGNLI